MQVLGYVLQSFGAQVGGPTWGPKWVGPRGPKVGWAHVGPMWVGPRGAHVGPKWAQARNLGPHKIKKIKILKIQIRSAQNVGKVWISRKKISWPHLGAFFAWAGKVQKIHKFCLFFLVGPWAHGPTAVWDFRSRVLQSFGLFGPPPRSANSWMHKECASVAHADEVLSAVPYLSFPP